jgi:cyanophycinase
MLSRKTRVLLLALTPIILLLFFCRVTNDNIAKGKLFIIGGGSRPESMVARMINEARLKEGGYVVILPMASEESDSAIIWSSEQFINQGINNVVGFNFKPGQEPKSQWIDSLNNASLIYISGGDQSKFMSIVKGTPILEAIHYAYNNGAIIAGTSAGAAVMSDLMITGNELRRKDYRSTFPIIESENLEISQGLGLLPNAIIDQHFVWRSRHNRLITAVIENPEYHGIGIDESTAVLIKGNRAEVVGESQVLVFRNPSKSKRLFNQKLGASNLQLDVYLPGEKFKI